MQQMGSNAMDNNDGKQQAAAGAPPLRGRQNSKLLVRSHAMREETSPPREPSPNHLVSPCIKLTPSPEPFPDCAPPPPKPVVVLSPSLSRGTSPIRSPPVATASSPTSTLVPSPASRCSPHGASDGDRLVHSDGDTPCSPKYFNRLNKHNSDCMATSQSNGSRKKLMCECQKQNCIKCINGHERNINNNLTNHNNNMNSGISSNTLSVTRSSSRGKLRQQSSSQGSFEGSSSNSPCLSRDSSSEQYTDTTGVDLAIFIPETLNRNAKDRAFMLRIEQELVTLAKDRSKTHYKFPPMSSYQRMLVHRCAAYFGMDHNIESSGKCVVVNKTKCTRIPDLKFQTHIKEDLVFGDEPPRRSILKRDSNSIEDYNFKSPDRSFGMENRRSKSFEEREEEYEKARRRIFNREMHDGSEIDWAETPWSSTESEYSGKFRLLPPDNHRRHFGKLTKVQSEDTGETMRPCVAKSYSFGGYGGGGSILSRGDSVMSTHSAGPRLLTKQDSAASSVSWRLSPSSSGYKSQSQMSESVTPSPTSTPHPESARQDSCWDATDNTGNKVFWAFSSLNSVPAGSVIINPQTGQPLKNNDGSIYHYDPQNLPACMITPTKQTQSPQKSSPMRIASPSKRSTKTSPMRTKSNLTNTATSPSLPYISPVSTPQQPPKSFQFVQQPGENVPNMPQPFPVYNGGYTSSQENMPVFPHQQYVVYTTTTPYIPSMYDGRIEGPPHSEIANTFYVAEGAVPPTQTFSYQQQPNYCYPNVYYPNNPQNPSTQRFAIPVTPQNQPNFIPTGYPPNYMAPTSQPQNPELVPIYPNQLQMVYQPSPPNQSGQVLYPNQPSVVYTNNPVYPNSVYQSLPQNIPPYPNTPTPNSCTSSASNPPYSVTEQTQQNYMQIAQGMQQMALSSNMKPQLQPQQYERPKGQVKNNKFGQGKFIMNSSQSSTGTNSPAATVVSGYCPPNAGIFRTPPDTPNSQYSYAPTFPAPQMYRQMSNNVRASTPVTARSSRSPTPASDYERQRMSLPPNLLQRMPYVLQTDTRMIQGRGQPNAYRQMAPVKQQQQQHYVSHGSDNRSHKGRKSKGNKPSGLPPSGRPA